MYRLPRRLRRLESSRPRVASDSVSRPGALGRARGRYSVIGAALVLVLGGGGVTYAAGMITGDSIKNGTVSTADIANYTLKLKDFSPKVVPGLVGPTVYSTFQTEDTLLLSSFGRVVSLDLPPGDYLASATGIVFEETNGDTFADCVLQASGTSAFGESATTIPSGGLYASVAAQTAFSAGSATTLEFACLGSNAGINKVSLTATRVGSLHTS